MIFNIYRPGRNDPAVQGVYGAIVAQARHSHFYACLPVPDTVEGRFDMIVLHATLLFHRFSNESEQTRAFGQQVFDLFFQDMEQSLRELGVGDVSVPKKITKMAEVFYGCAGAYAGALTAGDSEALAEALSRNILTGAGNDAGSGAGGHPAAAALAAYAEAAAQALGKQDADVIAAGTLTWIDPAPYRPAE